MKVDTNSYGSLLLPLINEKLPTDIRVIITRKFKSEVWDWNEMIEVLKLESKRTLIIVIRHLLISNRTNFHMRNFLYKK